MKLTSNHIKWCWKNFIFFYPKPLSNCGAIVKIAMSKNGKEILGNEKYSQSTKKEKSKLYDKINDLYLQVYKTNYKK